ncbi:MAG: hypothetical protein Q9168_001958 [Polycauliona sp. 1 TL-2023]
MSQPELDQVFTTSFSNYRFNRSSWLTWGGEFKRLDEHDLAVFQLGMQLNPSFQHMHMAGVDDGLWKQHWLREISTLHDKASAWEKEILDVKAELRGGLNYDISPPSSSEEEEEDEDMDQDEDESDGDEENGNDPDEESQDDDEDVALDNSQQASDGDEDIAIDDSEQSSDDDLNPPEP